MNAMKSLQDRFWLVLLGVAVAILVTLTTIYWKDPTSSRTGTDGGTVKPTSQRTVVPRLGTQVIKALTPKVSEKKHR